MNPQKKGYVIATVDIIALSEMDLIATSEFGDGDEGGWDD